MRILLPKVYAYMNRTQVMILAVFFVWGHMLLILNKTKQCSQIHRLRLDTSERTWQILAKNSILPPHIGLCTTCIILRELTARFVVVTPRIILAESCRHRALRAGGVFLAE
jgi:hypothetical protein